MGPHKSLDFDKSKFFGKQSIRIKLPFGVRCIIYSYLDLMTLINQQAKLSKKERDNITKSEIVD